MFKKRIDQPVHLGGYSDGKHIQFVCDGSWNEPKWGSEIEQRTCDPDIYVADDDRLYTFKSHKVSCLKCKNDYD